MKFTVENKKNNEILFTGTRQDCMHFIKKRRLNRQEITLAKVDNIPEFHKTVPVTVEEPEAKKGFFKRIYERL